LSSLNALAIDEQPEIHYVQREDSISNRSNVKILDIVRVYENVFQYYKSSDIFLEYRPELEYKFVRNLYGSFLLRALKIKDKAIKRKVIDVFSEKVESYFPEWRQNKYLKKPNKQNIFLRFFVNKITLKIMSHL
jgi:hypothetical protein